MTEKKGNRKNKQKPTKSTMRDWWVMKDREEALIDFIDALKKNPKERDCCVKKPAYAKKCFAHHGRFYVAGQKRGKDMPKPKEETSIPKATEFRVFEKFPIEDRDQLVTIVLPGPGLDEDIAQDWRCTYTPWAFKGKKK